MLEVGIKIWGSTNVKSTNKISLKRCITYKELSRYDVILLENCKDEEVEKVKALVGKKVYSIGATGEAIRSITLVIKDVDEIISEEDAIESEKQRSIEVLKETTAKKVELEKENEEKSQNISQLQNDLKDERDKVRELKEKVKTLENSLEETQKKLGAESDARSLAEKQLRETNEQLGNTIINSKIGLKEEADKLNAEHKNEIERINDIITGKDNELKKKDEKIEELNYRIEELSKSGAIPEINYVYEGKAKIISVISQGSYGCSNLVYTLYKLFDSQNKNVLVVDLDFKGGNLDYYMKKNGFTIENMLKGDNCIKDTVKKGMGGQLVEYVGGVKSEWQPAQIIGLDFKSIFEGQDYQYILVDGGTYTGYSIQSVIQNMLKRIGKVININVGKEIDGCINIRNYDRKGIPFISKITSDKLSFYEEPICRAKIQELLIEQIQ